jgi:hypothetical protein
MSEGRFAIGGLLLVAVWLFVGLPLLYAPPQTPKVQAQQHSDSAVKSEQHAQGNNPSVAKPNQQNATNHGEKAEEDGTEFWPPFLGLRLKITDSLLAVFTFGLFVFTGLLWRSTEKLWNAGEKQLRLSREALVADQRAWLILKEFEIESVKFGEVVDGVADVSVEINWRIENVGRTPALNHEFRMALIGNWGHEAEQVQSFAAKCLKFAYPLGVMVSSGAAVEESEILFESGREFYRYGQNGRVAPLVVGCITYQILQDSEFRQTAFAYRVERIALDPMRVGEDMTVNEVKAMTGAGGFAT